MSDYREKRKETVVSFSMWKIQIVACVATMVFMVAVLCFQFLLFKNLNLEITIFGLLLFIVSTIVIVCAHEAIHLIGFRYIGGVPWNELAWGVNWKLGVAYAHSKQPITVGAMKKVLLLPLIPTGLLPTFIGVAMNFTALSLLGVLLTAGCFGDFILYQKLLTFPNDAMVMDHPTKPQFTVYE